jgi:hypothetical protein
LFARWSDSYAIDEQRGCRLASDHGDDVDRDAERWHNEGLTQNKDSATKSREVVPRLQGTRPAVDKQPPGCGSGAPAGSHDEGGEDESTAHRHHRGGYRVVDCFASRAVNASLEAIRHRDDKDQ